MKMYVVKVALPLLVCLLVSATASAATVSGTITEASGTGLAGMEVRLWEQTPKGLEIAYTRTTASDGTYTFGAVATGTYAIDARMAPGTGGHHGDTWYDQVPPSSNGLFAADADLLNIAASDTLTGVDIALPLTGGFDGQILTPGSQALPNMVVRAESRADFRYHHNDFTDGGACCGGTRNGHFSMRGLVSTANGHDYRLLVYDHAGRYDLLVVPGPLIVTDSAAPFVGAYAMAPMPSDPAEPNDSAAGATAVPSLPFSSSDATIAPRGSDVDWYCYDAHAGDRLLARVDTDVTIDGASREHPWLDPIVSMWDAAGSQLIASNDDDPNASTLESALDTGELGAGRYCFAVSTYGDADWSGAQQMTAGGYDFTVEMGNRRPSIASTYEGSSTPAPPQTLAIDEGSTLRIDLSWSDPDGDSLTPQISHVDNTGQPAVPGTFIPSAGSGSYEWTPSQTGAAGSPYEVTFSVSDGEFSSEVRVVVAVNAVNLPPQTPVLDSPIGGQATADAQVSLTVENSVDADGDALTYEFEIHEDAPDGANVQTGSAPEDSSGLTSWTSAVITENATVYWRARAFDGNSQNGYSSWSDWETFLVDTANDAPAAPVIVKPTADQTVPVVQPRLSATVPEDPEGDALTLFFEVATDTAFADVVAASDAVDAPDTATNAEWTTTPALAGGTQYFVRARAVDARGAEGPWSEIVGFRVHDRQPPGAPKFNGSLGDQCQDGYTFEQVPDALTVHNVDTSGDELSFELQLFDWQAGNDAQPLYEISVPQSEPSQSELDQGGLGQTAIPIDTSVLEPGGTYRVRVRTVMGEATSAWRECQASVPSDEVGGDAGGEGTDSGANTAAEEGCGCSAAGTVDASWLALVFFGLLGLRLRRD